MQDRLLEQPIQGGRNAKLSHSATRFRNLHPFDRVWAIRAGSQLSFDLRSVFLHVRLELCDDHPVRTRRPRTAFGKNPAIRPIQVLWTKDLLHQRNQFH